MALDKLNLKDAYTIYVSGVRAGKGSKRLQHSIGAQFESYGIVEREMLRFYGLEPERFLIDVGCGSGRLAIPLSEIHPGPYLGTDVVPELLEFRDGNDAFVPLPFPLTLDGGQRLEKFGNLGQSICVLRKPARVASPL